jgi:hypothetical protein
MHKKYTGFYLGYVIQNNDPDRAGKVKIFIPALMPTLAGIPEEIDKEDADVKIDFKDFSTLPVEVIKKLKNILPWARQISPLIGSGSSTSYNPQSHTVTTVDNPIQRLEFAKKLKEGEFPVNDPKSAGFTLQQSDFILSAGHIKDEAIDDIPATPTTDPDNNAMIPELYSNQAKGMFSIPSVGSLVWVFFENGEWDLPAYFGYHYSSSEWKGIYGAADEGFRGVDYPNNFENNKEGEGQLLREKLIFNSRAGALSFTGTDYFPKINISHRDGSFIQMDNSGYKQMIHGKSSEFILGDEFKTVKGDSIIRSYKNYNIICDQSFSVRTGSRNYEVYKKAKEVIAERAAIFSKFKTDRTLGVDLSGAAYGYHIEKTDESQRRRNPNLYTAGGGSKTSTAIKSIKTLTPKEVRAAAKNNPTGLTIPPETASYSNIKQLNVKGQLGLKGGERPPIKENSKAWASSGNYRTNANKVGWDTRSSVDRSPSTAGGSFNPAEGTSVEEIKNKLIAINKKLDDVLKNEGNGGDQSVEITKDYYMRVGAISNDFPAVRVDPIGGIVFAGVVQGDNGASSIYKQTNLVEYTGNDSNFPCGNYTISCGNKFNIDAGTGGIILRTTGVSEIAGVTTKVSGLHLVELTTAGSMSIDAGKSLTITADILSLRQSKSKQIALGGSVGVENNITVGGSAIVNGELYVQHVTAPAEIQTTDQTYQLRGWSRRESSEFAEPIAAIPSGRIIVQLTKEICHQICRLGGVGATDDKKDSADNTLYFRGTESLPDAGTYSDGLTYVNLPAWNDNGVDYGVPPEYTYDQNIDEWVEKPGTGFSNISRDLPAESNDLGVGSGGNNNDVPIIGTNRVTSFEMEAHAHQFKNLPLSLRSTPQDVIAEARDVENYPEVRGISKGSRPAKVLVKGYGESESHKVIQQYALEEAVRISNNNLSHPNITGDGVGNQDDIRSATT